MSTRPWGAALTVAGALFALSACDTPSRNDFDSLSSQVNNLESRVTAAEASAAQSAAAADECSQVCTRAETMFQQSTRK
jgi:outer membrane murein-binding lipoprotein Lpp